MFSSTLALIGINSILNYLSIYQGSPGGLCLISIFLYFLTQPNKALGHLDPLSLSWSFEGIYLDVSTCSRSDPGTDQTLWWETLDLRRSQRRPTLWFFFWVAPKKWSMDLCHNLGARASVNVHIYDEPWSLVFQHLVGNQPPPKLVASHWPLQGRGGQRLGSHTLTSRDARDRAGLDGTLNLDPSPT